MLLLLRLEHKQKNSSNPFRICIFFFLSYSFGIEAIKMFIQSSSSHTKLGKVHVYPFSAENEQKPHPMGQHIPIIAYIRECIPPGCFCSFFGEKV